MGNNFILKKWLASQLILKLHDQGVLDAYLSLETFVEFWSESQYLERSVSQAIFMTNKNTLSVFIFYALL